MISRSALRAAAVVSTVAAACGLGSVARAQTSTTWTAPVGFPAPTASPTQAITGSVTASQPWLAQLQTANGNVTLHLHGGTVILDPALKGLMVGQRVYVRGFAQSDGSLKADEIDVVPALLPSSIIPPRPMASSSPKTSS